MRNENDVSLSVLVIPSGDAGDRFCEVLDDWYEAGLLRPAVWIKPEDVHVGEGRAPEIRGVMRSGSSETEGDLFAFLGSRCLALVRVILVQLLDGADSYDAVQIRSAMHVQFWIRESVPAPRIAASGMEIEGTEVRTINLVTGVTGLSDMPTEIVPRGWDVAAVTSPEDRPDPGRANAFVRAESNLHGVAILSTAVVANLIPGTTAGPFDDIDGDASAVLGKALVVRSTARALIGDTIVEDLAGIARSRALTPESLGVLDPHRFAVGERDLIVGDLLQWLDEVDEGVARPSRSTGVARSGGVMTVKTGVSIFLRFATGAVGVMVSGLWRSLLRRTETAATRAIVGEGSGIDLVLVPGVDEGLADDLSQIELADIKLHQDALTAAEQRPVRLPTQELWGALRDVAHAVVDGGALPAGAPRRLEGSKPVLLRDVGDVVPRPDDRFVIAGSFDSASESLDVASCAPAEARAGEQRITEALSAAQDGVADAKQAVEAASAAPGDEARTARIAEAKSVLATAEAQLRAVTKADRGFREWLERRRGSLFWKFRETNTGRLAQAAQAEAEAKQAAIQPSGLATNALTKLRSRFLWQSWAVVSMAVCIGIWMVLTAGSRAADLINELGTLVSCAVIALVIVIRAWYQGVLALLHTYEQAADRRARAATDFEKHHGDRRRFEEIERGTELWCDVVGWSLHTPWLDEERASAATDVRQLLASMPSAVQLAEPALDERDVALACRAAAAGVTTAGWRTRAYDRLVAIFSNLPADAGEVEAIAAAGRLDTPHGREELRLFRDELAAGQLQGRAGEIVLDEIEGILRRERLALSTLSVRPLGAPDEIENCERDSDFLTRALVAASPFAQETWSEQARVQGAHQDVITRAWSRESSAVLAASGITVAPVDESDLEDSRLIDMVVRSDVSAWLDLSKLRLFGRAASDTGATWTSGPGDSVFS